MLQLTVFNNEKHPKIVNVQCWNVWCKWF